MLHLLGPGGASAATTALLLRRGQLPNGGGQQWQGRNDSKAAGGSKKKKKKKRAMVAKRVPTLEWGGAAYLFLEVFILVHEVLEGFLHLELLFTGKDGDGIDGEGETDTNMTDIVIPSLSKNLVQLELNMNKIPSQNIKKTTS